MAKFKFYLSFEIILISKKILNDDKNLNVGLFL